MTDWARGYHDGTMYQRSSSVPVPATVILFLTIAKSEALYALNIKESDISPIDKMLLSTVSLADQRVESLPYITVEYAEGYSQALEDGESEIANVQLFKFNALQDVKMTLVKMVELVINQHLKIHNNKVEPYEFNHPIVKELEAELNITLKPLRSLSNYIHAIKVEDIWQ